MFSNVSYYFTYTVNDQECVLGQEIDGAQCFVHLLVVEYSFDTTSWTELGQFNQTSNAFSCVSFPAVCGGRNGQLQNLLPDNGGAGVYIRFKLYNPVQEIYYDAENFDWLQQDLNDSNCTDLSCRLQDIFNQDLSFNFVPPPEVIETCNDPEADNFNDLCVEGAVEGEEGYCVDDGSCVYLSDYEGDIVIVELLPKPCNNETAFEYIKLYNNSDEAIDLTGWYFKGFNYSGTRPGLDQLGLFKDDVADWYIPGYTSEQDTSGAGNDGEMANINSHTTQYLPAPSPIIQPRGFMMIERHGGSGPGDSYPYINYDSSLQFAGTLDTYDILDLRDELGHRVDFVEFNINNIILGKDFWDGLVDETQNDCPDSEDPLCDWFTLFSPDGIGTGDSGLTIELNNPNHDNNDPNNWSVTGVGNSGICDKNKLLYESYGIDYVDSDETPNALCSEGVFGGTPNRPNSTWNGVVNEDIDEYPSGEGCTIKSADNYNPNAYAPCSISNISDNGCCEFTQLHEDIIISEIHYFVNPDFQGLDEDYEFIEIHNRGEVDRNLQGVAINLIGNTDGPYSYVFGDVPIPTGGYIVLAKNANTYTSISMFSDEEADEQRDNPFLLSWGENLFQWKFGTLNNEFEIHIKDPVQMINNDPGFAQISYTNTEPWPSVLRGGSIEMIDTSLPSADLYQASNWQPSKIVGGTPGVQNTGGVDVVISEIQYIVPTFAEGWGQPDYEFIELHNPNDISVDMSSWELDSGGSTIYTFPEGTRIGADGFIVVARNAFTYDPLQEENADNETNRVQISHLIRFDETLDNAGDSNLFGPFNNIEGSDPVQQHNISNNGETINLFKPGITVRYWVDSVRFKSSGTGQYVSPFGEEFVEPFDLNFSDDEGNLKFTWELNFPETRNEWVDWSNYDATNWQLSRQWGGSPGFKRLEQLSDQCIDASACNDWIWDDIVSNGYEDEPEFLLFPESWNEVIEQLGGSLSYWPVPADNQLCIFPTTYCECSDLAENPGATDTDCNCCSTDDGANSCTGCTDSEANNENVGCYECDGVTPRACVHTCNDFGTDNDCCTYDPQNVTDFLANHGSSLYSTEAVDDELVLVSLSWTYDYDAKFPNDGFKIYVAEVPSNGGELEYSLLVDLASDVRTYSYEQSDNINLNYKITTLGNNGTADVESEGVTSELSIPNYGCTIDIASNYVADAEFDDNSCVLNTCTDSNALNYYCIDNSENCDDENNLPDISGLTIVDDGSCQYEALSITNIIFNVYDCAEGSTNNFSATCNGSDDLSSCITGASLVGISWVIQNNDGGSNGGVSNSTTTTPAFSAPILAPSPGDVEADGSYQQSFTATISITIDPFDPNIDSGNNQIFPYAENFYVYDVPVFGCTDFNSCDYNAAATLPCDSSGTAFGNNECCANYNIENNPNLGLCPADGEFADKFGCDVCGVCDGENVIPDPPVAGEQCNCEGYVSDDCLSCLPEGEGISLVVCDGTETTQDLQCACADIDNGIPASFCDECGVCGGIGPAGQEPTGNHCPDDGTGVACDCDGNCLDPCGICNGPGLNIHGCCDLDNEVDSVTKDCAGVCGGDATPNTCCGDVDWYVGCVHPDSQAPWCGENYSDPICNCAGDVNDCASVCGGSSQTDECGDCMEPMCEDIGESCRPYTSDLNPCGEGQCPTNPSWNDACLDCDDVPNGGNIIDTCGNCVDPSNACGVDCTCGDCGATIPNECGSCPDDNPFIEDLGCGCGELAPVCGVCDETIVDLGCECGNPAPVNCADDPNDDGTICGPEETCNPTQDCSLPTGCDYQCGSTLEFDECGECGGPGPEIECCTIDDTLIYTCLQTQDPENPDISFCNGVGGYDALPLGIGDEIGGDGVCDSSQIFGCTDASACNYNNQATDDDGSCTFPSDDGLGNYGGNTTDGTSEIFNCSGTCIATGNNLDSNTGLDCNGVCGGIGIKDECNVCDGDNYGCSDPTNECVCAGCTDTNACNYQQFINEIEITIENGTCTYSDSVCSEASFDGFDTLGPNGYDDVNCDCTCAVTVDCAGVCGGTSALDECTECNGGNVNCGEQGADCTCSGCTDPIACNYDDTATIDNDTCTYPDDWPNNIYACDGSCCDASIHLECEETYTEDCTGLCNGDAVQDVCGTCEGTCDGNPGTDGCLECGCEGYAEGYCDCEGAVLDECDVCGGDNTTCAGCMDDTACNYDETATIQCEYGNEGDQCCEYPDGTTCVCDDGSNTTPDEGYCDCHGNVIDDCQNCTDPLNPTPIDCAGVCETFDGVIQENYGSVVDLCRECGGSCNPPELGGPVDGCPDGTGGYYCDCEENYYDECTVCGGDGIAEGACDCSGNTPSQFCVEGDDYAAGETPCDCECNVLDECGLCTGDDDYTPNPGVEEGYCDCNGIAISPYCDCNGNTEDCSGDCGGQLTTDYCGVCGGGATEGTGELDGGVPYCGQEAGDNCCDCTGVAFPDGFDGTESQMDCAGVCNGSHDVDICGICAPNEFSIEYYTQNPGDIPAGGDINSINQEFSLCDNIYGDCLVLNNDLDCEEDDCYLQEPGCNGICYTGSEEEQNDNGEVHQTEGQLPPSAITDQCGECGGLCNYDANIPGLEFYSNQPCFNASCNPDCFGIPNGDSQYDCNNVCGGDAVQDVCGICDGIETNPLNCECGTDENPGTQLCYEGLNPPICAPSQEDLLEGENFSFTFYSKELLLNGGIVVLCLAADGNYAEIVESEIEGVVTCPTGTWTTENDYPWYSGVNYVGIDPFSNLNSITNEEGVCCSYGTYPDCVGNCKAFTAFDFEVPDVCNNCPSQALFPGTPFCLGDVNLGDIDVNSLDDWNCCDCEGIPNGDTQIDDCGICGGPGAIYGPNQDECIEEVVDCAGVIGGDATIDNCDLCVCPAGSDSALANGDCFIMYPNATMDSCGVCHNYEDIFSDVGVLETDWQTNGNWGINSDPTNENILATNADVEGWDCGDLNEDCPDVDQCGVCFGTSSTCAPEGLLTIIPETSQFGLSVTFIRIKPEGTYEGEESDPNNGGWNPIQESTTLESYELRIRRNGITLVGYPLTFDNTNNLLGGFVQEGHIHRFFAEGEYEITLEATDSSGFTGSVTQTITIDNIINIEQSVYNTYMPFQGSHVTSSLDTYRNNRDWFEISDRDKRPTLGTFYYDEDSERPWSEIGILYSAANKGTPGNSPDFVHKHNVDYYSQAVEIGLVKNIQLLYNTDLIDDNIQFYRGSDGGEVDSTKVWTPNNINNGADRMINVESVTDEVSYPISISSVTEGDVPSSYEDGSPKLYKVTDDSTQDSNRLVTFGFEKSPTGAWYQNPNKYFLENDPTQYFMYSTYLQCGDLTDSSYDGLYGNITKWDGSTGIFYSEPISESSGIVTFPQDLVIYYRYDGHAQVRLKPQLENLYPGCTDTAACTENYNPSANYNNGTCQYSSDRQNCTSPSSELSGQGEPSAFDVLGCTDPTLDNYNPLATYNDGSCGGDPELDSETQGKWKTSSGYKGYFTVSEGKIILDYFSGTKLEADIKKLARNGLAMRFAGDSLGEYFSTSMIWDNDSKDLLWVDDSGGNNYITIDSKTDNNWYRVWLFGFVNAFDESGTGTTDGISVKVEFLPTTSISLLQSSKKGDMYYFGPQLERINIGQVEPSAYVRDSNPDEPLEDEPWPSWAPDVDVRTVKSNTGLKTTLYNYFDNQLQREEYLETVAPSEVQFYFYRRLGSGNIYEDRSAYQFLDTNPLYIASVDWGDNSPLEYNIEPFEITGDSVIKHNYTKPGVYEVTGIMFDACRGCTPADWNTAEDGEYTDVYGVIDYKKFTIRFNLHLSEDEEQLIYINYQNTTPIIGGISRNSIYYKNTARNAGYIFPPNYNIESSLESPIGLKFAFYNDAVEVENALYQMDELLIGKNISPFTGSYYNQSDEVGNYDDTIPADSDSIIYRGKYSYGGELGKHPGSIDLGDVNYFQNGKLHMSDLLGFVNQPLDKSFGIIEGEGAVLISAPHGCINNRPTINALHAPDDNTGALAVEIGRLTGAHVIYGTYTVDDANFYHYIPDPGDSDYYTPAYQQYVGELLPYKERLKRYIENHPEIKLVIDYHGANYKRYFAVDLGFRGDRNIPGDSVGPFGDDEYPAYSFTDALEDPETYTPSLRTEWGKGRGNTPGILELVVSKMNEAGIGGDITDWPEGHCDPGETGWESGVTWDSTYFQDLGGWDGNQNGVPDTEDDCPDSWLDFYNDGVGSEVDLGDGNMMSTGGIALQRYFTAKKRPTITNYITRHNEADNLIDDPNYAGDRSWIDDVAMTGEIDAIQIEWSRVYRTIEPSSEYQWLNGEDVGIGNGDSKCEKSPGCNRTSAAKNIKSMVEFIKAVNAKYQFIDLEDEALRGTDTEYDTRIELAVENAWTIQKQIFEGVIDYPLDETVEENNNPINPVSDRYWKNIIPDFYEMDFRTGINTYYNLTNDTHERLGGAPICGTNTAAASDEDCVNTSPVVGLTLPQTFDLFYVWFGDPEYSWEHKTEITIKENNTLTTTAGVTGTWEVDMSTGLLTLTYSSGTTFTGTIDFNTASVPRYKDDGVTPNATSVDFTGREGYFIIPDLEFGDSLDFITQYGYRTVNRTDGTIFWPLENLEVGSELFNSIFDNTKIEEIQGVENNNVVNIISAGDNSWSGDLTIIRKNSYYNIKCFNSVDSFKLLLPSVERDGNGIVNDNFEINVDDNQEWLGKNEYDNIYYYPVLPKLDIFGKFDINLGLQQGTYNPFQFEENVELIFDETEDGDDPNDLQLPESFDIEKIPFGSTGRNWFEDDFKSPITNNKYRNKDKVISLDYTEIEDRIIQDSAGFNNYGEILSDYLIEYDNQTREPSTSGVKEVNSLQSTDKNNSKRNY